MRMLVFMSLSMLLMACAPQSQTPTVSSDIAEKEAEIQREMAVKSQVAYIERAQDVAQPVLLNNTEFCGKKIAAYTGFQILSRATLPKQYRDTYTRLFKVQDHPTIVHVTKGSPAHGKLQIGDAISKIDGKDVRAGKTGMEHVLSAIEDNETGTPFTLTVLRGESFRDVTIDPVIGCAGQVAVVSDNSINAFADGKNIILTTGMMDFADKDEDLAIIVGHELAHNTRNHIEAKRGNALIGGILGAVVSGVTGVNVMGLGSDLGGLAYSQGFEVEADYVGLYHTARAGYKIDDAANFWRRMAAKNPTGIDRKGSTHPTSAQRFVLLQKTIDEINAKKARGEALIPEEKSSETFEKEIGQLNG